LTAFIFIYENTVTRGWSQVRFYRYGVFKESKDKNCMFINCTKSAVVYGQISNALFKSEALKHGAN
jgi:hypothetical protein